MSKSTIIYIFEKRCTQCQVNPEAIIEVFQKLGGTRTVREIENWVTKVYGPKWKDFGTSITDMVPESKAAAEHLMFQNIFRVLERVERGKYRLIDQD
ncbi:hypothetical protein KHA80_22715 [Anaerobacillus sp. HL2]|nr:hypothetical protein KHA80_22715 [Anaerobacillus sp. HL2]